jgi:FMN phosphatase YigB (HAD superfamily)
MDLDRFTKTYLGALTQYLAANGYDAECAVKGVWTGILAMFQNDGSRTNEDAFWDAFSAYFGEDLRRDIPIFERFYQERFDDISAVCGYEPRAKAAVAYPRSRGLRVVLATNPAFPAIATEKRMRWAGVEPDDFDLYTAYEDWHSCKPHLSYYKEVLERLGVAPEECLMVGNDVGDDMVAERLGMRVFLLTDCLINKEGADVDRYPHGGYDELMKYLEEFCG